MDTTAILKRFETPDAVLEMVKGRFELVRVAGLTVGRATYEPGWRWSEHVRPDVDATFRTAERVGLVLSGTGAAVLADGQVLELRSGALFSIPAEPHDRWVVGDEPFVSLHFLEAGHDAW